jgi:hypothetical protein
VRVVLYFLAVVPSTQLRFDFMRISCLVLAFAMPLLTAAALPTPAAKRKFTPPAAIGTVTKTDLSSGRVVRSVVIQPRQVMPRLMDMGSTTPLKPVDYSAIGELVRKTSSAHGVDPLLVSAIIHVESGYNPRALSPKGAEGLMQLMPETGRRFGAKDAFDPEDNIRAGVKYFRYLQDMFKDDRLALAAYNAGENAVLRYGWIPPYQETVEYVYKVGKKYGENRRVAGTQTAVALAPKSAETVGQETKEESKESQPRYRPVEYYVDEEGKLFLKTR